MVASAPELAQHRTVLRNSGEHGHGHCVANQGQARQQTTPHCREQISMRIHNKTGEMANPDPQEGNSLGRIMVLRNGLIQLAVEDFSKQTTQDGTGSAGREAGNKKTFSNQNNNLITVFSGRLCFL
jgi:hypothetical protein